MNDWLLLLCMSAVWRHQHLSDHCCVKDILVGAIMSTVCGDSCMSFLVNVRLTFAGTDTQVLVACSSFGFVFKVVSVTFPEWLFHFVLTPVINA